MERYTWAISKQITNLEKAGLFVQMAAYMLEKYPMIYPMGSVNFSISTKISMQAISRMGSEKVMVSIFTVRELYSKANGVMMKRQKVS